MQRVGRYFCGLQNVSRLTRVASYGAHSRTKSHATGLSCRQFSTQDVSPKPAEVVPDEVPTARFTPTTAANIENLVSLTEIARQAQRYAVVPLPTSCPGCGALSQESETTSPGYYTRKRKHVRTWFKHVRDQEREKEGEESKSLSNPYEQPEEVETESPEHVSIPFCDRCHDLVHEHKGVAIDHPSIHDIADSIAESPHKQNHVYHVLDAADFPMSLIPSFHRRLSLAKPRSQNRRSKHDYTVRPSMSFIITRSDLLAPTKEKVDSLMPYFRSLLRQQLGRTREGMRLGNLHLVSAKRGWWTKELKDEIWHRGGGNWMVGKFNVGKSNLFEVIFPKGSGERAPVYSQLVKEQAKEEDSSIPELLPEGQLLPPPQPEMPFPTLPLVSSLPGTTASPIRLPFGNKKGELVDMPGLERGNLDQYISAEHKLDLVMENRPKVSQHNIKPGQSLLLGGGVVRITPVLKEGDDKTVVQAYPFVPLTAHVTSTSKAIDTQQHGRESGIKSILASNVGSEFRSAGLITLETDVTKLHAGSILRTGVKLDRLPFRIYAADVLIQGVGWVEVTCQVRHRPKTAPTRTFERPFEPDVELDPQPNASEAPSEDLDSQCTDPPRGDLEVLPSSFQPYVSQVIAAPSNPNPLPGNSESYNHLFAATESEFPQIEVFTPNGEHISSRPPMNAWTLWKEGTLQKNREKGVRPRKPMKGAKKAAKLMARTK